MISCSEATRQLWEYLDATTDTATREAIEEHLNLCRRCCGELEFARELRRLLADARHDDIPPGVFRRPDQALKELEP